MASIKKIIRFFPLFSLLLLVSVLACQTNLQSIAQTKETLFSSTPQKTKQTDIASVEIKKLLESAVDQTNLTKSYGPAYVVIPYPNGDVPVEKGVCTDVVIRAFRKAGVDLQKEVHEDMAAR